MIETAHGWQAGALPSRYRHCVHCYHTVDAWDRHGERLLYAGFTSPDDCAIVVRAPDGTETELARTPLGHFHTAARQRWALDDAAVCFQAQFDADTQGPALATIDAPGRVELLREFAGCGIRQIVDHGHVGYGSGPRGACRFDLRTRELEVLFTGEQAAALLPPSIPRPDGPLSFNHVVANRDQSFLFAKLMGSGFVAFFTFDLLGGELICHGNRISGHPCWMPNGRDILNVKSPRDGSDNRHLVLVDARTAADRRLVDLPIEGPGHPTPSPDGRLAVTDAFTADGLTCPIYLIDLASGVTMEIARLAHRFAPAGGHLAGNLRRGQPHPVWAPDSRRLLVNFNYAGDHMGLVVLHAP